MFAMYGTSLIPAMMILYYFFGNRVIAPSVTSAAMVPLLIVSTHFGLKVGTLLGRQRLRNVTLAILILIGLSGLAAPLLQSH